MKTYFVYYAKNEALAELIWGDVLPELETLNRTHVFLKSIEAENLEAVFTAMQGEVWSPNGEARSFILGKGLGHTSMCVGDVVATGDRFYAVAMFGFKQLLPYVAPKGHAE